jgi:hypothetical protein
MLIDVKLNKLNAFLNSHFLNHENSFAIFSVARLSNTNTVHVKNLTGTYEDFNVSGA